MLGKFIFVIWQGREHIFSANAFVKKQSPPWDKVRSCVRATFLLSSLGGERLVPVEGGRLVAGGGRLVAIESGSPSYLEAEAGH